MALVLTPSEQVTPPPLIALWNGCPTRERHGRGLSGALLPSAGDVESTEDVESVGAPRPTGLAVQDPTATTIRRLQPSTPTHRWYPPRAPMLLLDTVRSSPFDTAPLACRPTDLGMAARDFRHANPPGAADFDRPRAQRLLSRPLGSASTTVSAATAAMRREVPGGSLQHCAGVALVEFVSSTRLAGAAVQT